MYLLLPVYQKVTMGGVILSGIITAISVLVLTYYLPNDLPLVVRVGPCIYWLIFFAIGAYYSNLERNYSLWLPFTLLVIGGVTQIIEYNFLSDIGRDGIGLKFSSWVYSLGAILVLISDKVEKLYRDNVLTSFIKYIGDNSFGIYLVHMLTLIIITRFISDKWVVAWGIAVIASLIIIIVSKMMLPNLSRKYLGFKQ